jgi:hypothetical protein
MWNHFNLVIDLLNEIPLASKILKGKGFRLMEAKNTIEIVRSICKKTSG